MDGWMIWTKGKINESLFLCFIIDLENLNLMLSYSLSEGGSENFLITVIDRIFFHVFTILLNLFYF